MCAGGALAGEACAENVARTWGWEGQEERFTCLALSGKSGATKVHERDGMNSKMGMACNNHGNIAEVYAPMV